MEMTNSYSPDEQKRKELMRMFVEDCRFAHIVETPNGQAIQVGFSIINVIGPRMFCGNEVGSEFFVDALTTALRSITPSMLSAQAGDMGASALGNLPGNLTKPN